MTQIVSSISSLEIYAPSAGTSTYAKCDTNGRALTKLVESADVSAYQVVSATGSQLYAGTAHLTSVNQAPISAARAGNAANASMANSAYYDGAGRLISSLPDSATVSAIASSYASSKADASSLSSYALSADVSGVIDTVSSNSASWAGGGGVDSATVSAIASSYADKCWPLTSMADLIQASGQGVAISYGNESLDIGKAGTYSPMTIHYSYGGQPTANFHLNNNSVYGGNTSNNTSYYWILNRTGVSGRYYDGTAKEWHYTTAEYDKLTSTHDTVYANSATWGQGGGVDSATVSAIASSYAESAVSSKLDTTAQVVSATAGDGTYITSINGMGLSGQGGGTGNYWPISASVIESTASAIYINHQSNMMTIIGRSASYSNAGITFKEDGHPERSAGLSYTHVFGGNTSDASGRWWSLGLSGVFASGGDLPGAWKYGSAEYDYLTSTHDTVSSNSASWGATPSAFPAEINTGSTTKAIVTIGFQDGTGSRPTLFISSNPNSVCYPRMLVSENHGATGKSSTYLSDAFEFYTGASANGTKVLRIDTGKISGTGFYLDSNIIQGDDWSYGTSQNNQLTSVYDTVNTQSANWGGSALALSAGPGVKLEKVGNTLVASTDETVLWENTAGRLLANGITLSESRLNFEMLRFYMAAQIGKSVISYDMPMYGLNRTTAFAIQPSMPFTDAATTGFAINWQIAITATDSTMASVQALFWGKNNFGSANSASGSWTQGVNNGGIPAVYKVIGINRTAEV